MSKAATQVDEITRKYTNALAGYLKDGGEADLQRAYEIGRRCLADGRSIIEVISIHNQALQTMANGGTRSAAAHNPVRAGQFLTECISPFEMTHRAFGEANQALRRLNDTLEEQARFIARELHDQSGQLLAAIHIELDEAMRDLPAATRGRIEGIKCLLDKVEKQLRDLSHEIRPTILDDLGLVAGLESLAQRVARRTGLRIVVRPFVGSRLPAPVEIALYRIVQEALNNVARHAHATSVNIRLRQLAKEFRCSIRDNGVGFDSRALETPGRRGLGMLGMKERLQSLGGTLRVESEPGRGTKLEIIVPLED